MSNPLLELCEVYKRYKSFSLESASFSITGGTFMGLIGPNVQERLKSSEPI